MSPWIIAARPKTLFASMAPVLLGLSLVSNNLNFPVAIITLLCALLLQVATNYVNDYFDGVRGLDDEDRLGPQRAIQAGLITPKKLLKGIYFVYLLSLLLGIFLMMDGGTPIILIGTSSLIFAFIYTGGPLPLSHYGLGEVFAFIFFGPVAVWGTWFLQTHELNFWPIYVGMIPGFFSAAIMAINNLRDRSNDGPKGKLTLAVFFSEKVARTLPILFVTMALLTTIAWSYHSQNYYLLLSFLILPIYIGSTRKILSGTVDHKLNDELANTGKLLFLFCLIITITLSIQKFL